MAVISERSLDQSSELFRTYASWWFYDSATTLDQAKRSGFKLDVVYEGIPLSAIWHNDSNTKKTAREKWAKIVNEAYLKKSFESIDEVRRDPRALELYNECARTIVLAREDMVCFFSPATDRATAWLTIVLRPRSDFVAQRVSSSISNGYVIPDLSSLKPAVRGGITSAIDEVRDGRKVSLPQGAKTTLELGGAIRAGAWSFELARLDPNAKITAVVRLANGIKCEEASLKATALRTIEWSLWPEARDWDTTNTTFRYFQRKESCGKSVSPMAQEFCLAEGDLVKSWNANPMTGNCGSVISKISVADQKRPNCVRVVGDIKGCGHDIVRACKGRGWVDSTISVTGAKPLGARVLSRASTTQELWAEAYNGRFDYESSLPSDLKVDRWRYKVVVTNTASNPRRSFTLSDDRPEYTDPFTGQRCTSSTAHPGERTGFVSWSCTLPTVDAHRAMSQVIAGADDVTKKSVVEAAKALTAAAPPASTVAKAIERSKLPPLDVK
jgi:hypothetical protein